MFMPLNKDEYGKLSKELPNRFVLEQLYYLTILPKLRFFSVFRGIDLLYIYLH